MPHVTVYQSLTQPASWRAKNGDLTTIIPRHTIQATKENTPLFSPAELVSGTSRNDKNVVAIHFGVLDIDGVAESDLVSQLPFQHSFLLYSSYSHVKKGGAWRVLIPLTRPVTPEEWPDFWPRLNDLFGQLGDPKCKSRSHAYFLPAVPSAEELPHAVYDWNDGETVDVDALLSAPLSPVVATPVATITLEAFRSAARRQKRHMRARFDALLAGESFAKRSERNNVSFQMMRDLARELPDIDPESVRPFLAPSIDNMKPDGGFNLDIVVRQFADAQRAHAIERVEQTNAARERAADNVERAFHRTPFRGRREPYTEAEIALFAEHIGVKSMQNYWVLQHKTSYYAFLAGEYVGPITKDELVEAHLLAPASSAGVEILRLTKSGSTPKTWQDLVIEYGTRIEKVVADLGASAPYFDPDTRTLYEAPCPMRPIEPRFDAAVDQWMRHFAGENYDKFVAWMAGVPEVREPTAVLFIKAQRGSGKTMLMNGLGRLWLAPGQDPPEVVDTMATSARDYNDAMLRCPLTVADENFPPNRSAELRRFMQARSHTLRRKFLPVASVFGTVRVIIAANNTNLLKIREVLTVDDVEAIGERILFLQPGPEAREYLLSLGDRPRAWVDQDILAAHCRWLHQNHHYQKGSRFLVEGQQGSLHRSIAISTSVSSAVCEWVARFLRDPNKALQCDVPTVMVRDEEILVSPSGLSQYWDLYTTNFKPAPELRDVSTALQAITLRDRRVVKVKGKATHFRIMNKDFLRQWADDNDWGDLE